MLVYKNRPGACLFLIIDFKKVLLLEHVRHGKSELLQLGNMIHYQQILCATARHHWLWPGRWPKCAALSESGNRTLSGRFKK